LKSTQEDPWQVFARTHAIGQYAPGKVTKIVPFGAFVRVADGIEGLVHISELSSKHIDLASQVVAPNQDVFVKVIDIDLDRRRISLSLKQATEEVDPNGTDFNPALYGLATDFDDQGNYKYPEGFDAATSEWKPGFEDAKAKWEKEYAEAQSRWEEHKKQVAVANELAASLPDSKPVDQTATSSSSSAGMEPSAGTLSEDASLAALKEKLGEAE
jgi:small subunit ribosomal protein S1